MCLTNHLLEPLVDSVSLILFAHRLKLNTFFHWQGSRQDAGVALKWFWGRQADTQTALANIQSDLDALTGDAKFSDLFTVRANLMALIISLALMLFQQFSGINAVIFYAQVSFCTNR